MNRDTLIMLDLDGTIIDTAALYFQGVPMVVERYLGITIDGNALLPFWGQFAKTIFAHFAKTVGIQDTEPVEEMYAAFSAYSNANHNRLSTVYEGVEETLGDMKKAVHALGVVTTRPSDRSAPVLEMAWTRHIDFFVWGDQVRRNKPFPDGIEKAINDHAIDGAACVYVGDNANDIKAAQACRRRVLSVAALWGAMDSDGLRAACPDHSFSTFTEFAHWVIRGGPTGGLIPNA
jgi:pyrophosphatase PpaX